MKLFKATLALTFFLTIPLIGWSNTVLETAADSSILVEKINGISELVHIENRIISQLTNADLSDLPLAIEKNVGGKDQYILIDNMRIAPGQVLIDIYMLMDIPSVDRRLAFAALDINIHDGGLAAAVGTRLTLVTTEDFDIGDNLILRLKGRQRLNYVEWDCNGFRSLSIDGQLEINGKTARPVGQDGKPTEGPVVMDFRINSVADPSAIMLAVNVPTFELISLPGFTFKINNAVVDFSDIANMDGFTLPQEYREDYGAFPGLWTGLYFSEVSVGLPNDIKSSRGRVQINGSNMFIDKHGFTGALGASNLLDISDGAMANWPVSVDSLNVVMLKSNVIGATFAGDLKLPLFDTPMDYDAAFRWDNADKPGYDIRVTTLDELHSDLWLADVKLDSNSMIRIFEGQRGLEAEAILNGSMELKGGAKLAVSGLDFQKLHIASEAPIIRSGYWGLQTKKSLVGGFPIKIDSIGMLHNGRDIALIVGARLAFMDKEDNSFSARTTVQVNGEFVETVEGSGETEITKHDFKFKNIKVGQIGLSVKRAAFELSGTVTFLDDHPLYGNGFSGDITATITELGALHGEVFFGKTDFRYWYFGVRVDIATGIPLAGPISIYSVGGGISYHMATRGLSKFRPAAQDITHVPDEEIGLKIKAGVTIGLTGNTDAFNGDMFYQVAFSSSGGLKYIEFVGENYLATPMNMREDPKFYGINRMLLDFENNVLHATMETFIDLPVMYGIGPNFRATFAELYISSDLWFLHIGTPSDPAGVAIGPKGKPLAIIAAYFVLGNDLPEIPPLPPEVAHLGDNLGWGEDKRSSGIGFGAYLDANLVDLKFLGFYAQIRAKIGFDIAIKDRSQYSCLNTGEAPGINGWYASGQAYAYLLARVGIKVRLKFIKGDFEILRLAVAAVLQAELPNPSYFRGAVSGEFSILGGLVKGKCNFKFTVGERCETGAASNITGVEAIAALTPVDDEKDVNVFTKPQLSLNLKEGKSIELLNNDNEYEFYRITLDEFNVYDMNGQLLAGSLIWNEQRDLVTFNADEVLPPESKVTAVARVSWEEKDGDTWRSLGDPESKTVTFQVGEAPKNIPEHNVKAGYPYLAQYNFYPDEADQGYILLETGQEYLFAEKDMNYTMRFVSLNGGTHETDVTYNTAQKKVSFPIPDIINESGYRMVLVRSSKNDNIALDQNVSVNTQTVMSDGETEVIVEQRDLTGSLIVEGEFNLYESYFRTSRFNTFAAKMNSMTNKFIFTQSLAFKGIARFGLRHNIEELFDQTEARGNDKFEQLIQITPEYDHGWYRNYAGPAIYNDYPIHPDVNITWRDLEDTGREGGTPPSQPIILQQTYFPTLTQDDVDLGAISAEGGEPDFMHDWDFYGYYDHFDIQNKAVNTYRVINNQTPQHILNLLNNSYDNLDGIEALKFIVRYKLPGTDIVTTEKLLVLDLFE